jgi:hypothetical protein
MVQQGRKAVLEPQEALVMMELQVFWDLKAAQVQLEPLEPLVWGLRETLEQPDPLVMMELKAMMERLAPQGVLDLQDLQDLQVLQEIEGTLAV